MTEKRIVAADSLPGKRIGSIFRGKPAQAIEVMEIARGITFSGIPGITVDCLVGQNLACQRLYLTLPAAIELVKGILEHAPYISIVSDDELMKTVQDATTLAAADAEAMAALLKERREGYGGGADKKKEDK